MHRPAGDDEDKPRALPATMRMAELSSKSGVPRETIHFYLREGLLPRPKKGGRTVAWYGDEHLDRLKLIRRLREEKYLPLAVIRRLLDSPAAADDRDVDALAEVLDILPSAEPSGTPPSAAARAAAIERGLLGPSGRAGDDAAERRVLAVVEEALALTPRALELTLSDLEACARDLTGMVTREAELFFDEVLTSGDVGGSIAALRAGRGAVARFIAAYRDLMLRRAVEDVIDAIRSGPDAVARTAWVPLSHERERALRARDRDDAIASDEARLVQHLFLHGATVELAALANSSSALPAREAALVAWGAHAVERTAVSLRMLERKALAAQDSPLAQILFAEAAIARALRHRDRGESILEEAVPALRRLVRADPDAEPEAWARALAWFLRGRLELSLPAVLGRRARGRIAVDRALRQAAETEGDAFEPSARARLELNANLALARHHLDEGDREAARARLDAAVAVDPDGPVAIVARAERARILESP